MSFRTPEHFCTCPMAAVTIKTTGPRGFHNDLVGITVMPLGLDMRPTDDLLPMSLTFCPKRPENFSKFGKPVVSKAELVQIIDRGVMPSSGKEKFHAWYKSLSLKPNKRIIPLVWDWSKTRPFIEDFFGYTKGVPIMDEYFSDETRSLRQVTSYLNDVSWAQSYPYPFVFQDNRLSRTITSCDDLYDDPLTTYGECLNLATAFRNLIAIKSDMGKLMVQERYK